MHSSPGDSPFSADALTRAEQQFDETARLYGGKAAWQRARKAGKTKLDYYQWVQVRTPAFRAWFGDWEIARATPARKACTFAQARQAANEFRKDAGGNLLEMQNEATGINALVSGGNLDKMLSKSAVAKSASFRLQALVVANIDRLFQRALFGWSKPDRAGDPNIVALHRFFAPLLDDGRRARLVKLTVKERSTAHNSIYSVEAVELGECNPGEQWVLEAARLNSAQ